MNSASPEAKLLSVTNRPFSAALFFSLEALVVFLSANWTFPVETVVVPQLIGLSMQRKYFSLNRRIFLVALVAFRSCSTVVGLSLQPCTGSVTSANWDFPANMVAFLQSTGLLSVRKVGCS